MRPCSYSTAAVAVPDKQKRPQAGPTRTAKARAEITAFHETYPGHHLQVAVAQSQPVHPIAQLVWTAAFGEGWARYAEGSAEEAGLYRAPVASLTRRVWPGRGMVADVGLHLLGWPGERVTCRRKWLRHGLDCCPVPAT